MIEESLLNITEILFEFLQPNNEEVGRNVTSVDHNFSNVYCSLTFEYEYENGKRHDRGRKVYRDVYAPGKSLNYGDFSLSPDFQIKLRNIFP